MSSIPALDRRVKAIEKYRVNNPKKLSYEESFRAEYFIDGQWLDGWDIDAIEGETFDAKMSNVVHITLNGLATSSESRYKARLLLDLYASVASRY